MSKITVFYNELCLLHSPPYEILSGHVSQWYESPLRIESIKRHLVKFPATFPVDTATRDYGIEPILAIHDPDYVQYLQTIYPQWVKEGGNPEAGVVPEVMLHRNLLPAGFVPSQMHSIGRAGLYHFDLSSTVTAETWKSAYAAVQTALTATEAALNLPVPNTGDSKTLGTFALIRPPGHHATTNLCGGYCYLNNVVICASYVLCNNPSMKCVIVDVDFHHGNGVEEILQRDRPKPIVNGNHNDMADDWRDRCKYISLHAHPDYPYYTTHLPTSLPKSVTAEKYLHHLRTNLDEVKTWCTNDTLVLVSLGLDTLSTDPIGGFAGIEYQSHFKSMGGEIGNFVHQINGKTCFLLEGGYVVDKLGECVEGVFRGYMQTVHTP